MGTIISSFILSLMMVSVGAPAKAQNTKELTGSAIQKLGSVNKVSGQSKGVDPNLSLHLGHDGATVLKTPSKANYSGSRSDNSSGDPVSSSRADSSRTSSQGKSGGQ